MESSRSTLEQIISIFGGPPKQLTTFTSEQIKWFDLARDGKPNLFACGADTD